MKITADTNLLVRAVTGDDSEQTPIAQRVLETAELVAIPASTLCELVWVLARGYNAERADIARIVKTLIASETVATDRPAVAAGLAVLDGGGDFADGVIAYEGRQIGGEVFASFDKRAVRCLNALGVKAAFPD